MSLAVTTAAVSITRQTTRSRPRLGGACPRSECRPVLWVRSAFFAVLGPGTVLIGIPMWLSRLRTERLELGSAQWFGVPVLMIGVAGLLLCIWDFGRRGKGTLAPMDPPRFVVRSGLFRVARNPMYLSVLTALAGEALLFRSLALIAWAGIVGIWFHLFVVAYEEPRLRRQFGAPYEEYCSTVARWRPRRPIS